MIVIHFKIRCRPDKTEEMRAALEAVIAPAREVDGVVSFDIARDLTDEDSFIATEVFRDDAARERQESLAETKKVLALLPDSIAAPTEATLFRVTSSEPAM